MEFDILVQAIATVGFPIAACCVMFWQNSKLQSTLTDIALAMQKMSDELDKVADELRDVKRMATMMERSVEDDSGD